MSAIETAVKTAITNVLSNFLEKNVGADLPMLLDSLKLGIEKIATFESKLDFVIQQNNEILHKLNLQATGGMSIAEQIEFGSNIIREEANPLQKSFDRMLLEANNGTGTNDHSEPTFRDGPIYGNE